MLEFSVVNLVIIMVLELFKEVRFPLALEKYG
jgi:hypothetical protein